MVPVCLLFPSLKAPEQIFLGGWIKIPLAIVQKPIWLFTDIFKHSRARANSSIIYVLHLSRPTGVCWSLPQLFSGKRCTCFWIAGGNPHAELHTERPTLKFKPGTFWLTTMPPKDKTVVNAAIVDQNTHGMSRLITYNNHNHSLTILFMSCLTFSVDQENLIILPLIDFFFFICSCIFDLRPYCSMNIVVYTNVWKEQMHRRGNMLKKNLSLKDILSL